MKTLPLRLNRYLLSLLAVMLVFTLMGCIADEDKGGIDATPTTTQEADQLKPIHIPIIMTAMISFFTFLIGLAIVWYLFASMRNKQRHEVIMALIEKGEYEPALFEGKGKYRKEYIILSAIILIALGVALIIGVPIASKKLDGIIAGLIPFFIGWGLFFFYYILGWIQKSKSASNNAH